jgi:predicted AAA+ superfamily ATPase
MVDGNLLRVEEILSNILKDYSLDFVKHTIPTMANKISHVWHSLPSQLSKENHKFIYQLIRPGARAREYEDALLWLKNAGLIHQINLCREPRLPLTAYDELSIFKVYTLDIGILRRLAGMEPSVYQAPAEQFKEFRGALTENYVLQSLLPQFEAPLRYWTSGNQVELEFLIQQGNNIIPVDAKAGRSIISKSMTEYTKSYSPALRLRYSMLNLVHDGTVLNIPLFLADRTRDFIHFALDS